ncbi:uncharacterized protein E0L32_009673 [Thyridium curvatum]|uniref:Uncharacterized protein n=1 Tax=Thyridium curvatum TaxID=1093900 RepID=A0A507AGH9_9PEZI|nr:uncharacterized protein E0L32_009673 [Thyridium curvatum]TPX08855.1 hypothetical protein E0L32_009673 [Thyridium curvatum]
MPQGASSSRRHDDLPLSNTADSLLERPDRQGRRRPFSTWVKKLTNFKGGSSGEPGRHGSNTKRNLPQMRMSKKRGAKENNPYPQSGRLGNGSNENHDSHQSFSTAQSALTSSATSMGRSESVRSSLDGHAPPTAGARSMAPTVSTDHEASRSVAAQSHAASSVAGTSRTANGGLESRRGEGSTFSSPAPSVRSLTTTLTTIQSLGPNTAIAPSTTNGSHHQHSGSQVIHFNQPFPNTPASAIPSHLTPSGSTPGNPTTYASATANNLLTDNASILTLASSSKRRRRRSFDTDASVRALAPSSLWGGSRESLPLSVLSANMDGAGAGTGVPVTPGLQHTRTTERTSIYSATGGILSSERNSFYAKRDLAGGGAGVAGDGASVRSGAFGHGRADSVNGSIGGLTSPLASPREAAGEKEKELGKGKDVEESYEKAPARDE